jgi:hypothetical protein
VSKSYIFIELSLAKAVLVQQNMSYISGRREYVVNKNLIGLRKREMCLSGSHAYQIPSDNQGKGRCQASLWTIAEF